MVTNGFAVPEAANAGWAEGECPKPGTDVLADDTHQENVSFLTQLSKSGSLLLRYFATSTTGAVQIESWRLAR